jgi:hypothetical protein
MRKAVANIAQTAFLDVLLDGVERFLFGDLHLGVGPPGNLDNHVEDAIVHVSEERDVVKGRHDGAILFNVDTVF